MTVTTTTWDAIQQKNEALIRKTLEGSVFTAPYAADAITTLTSGMTGALVTLPALWGDVGLLSTDGAQFSRALSTSVINSWGRSQPSRSDVTSDIETLKIACQETKLQTIGLYLGVDMTAVTPDATSGEVSIAAPDTPPPLYYRVLTVSVDLSDGGDIYIGKFYPRAQVTAFDDQKQANGDDPLLYGVTFTAFKDDVLGYSRKNLWGGPGWQALATDMALPS